MKPLPGPGTKFPVRSFHRFPCGFTVEPRSISRRPHQIPRPSNPPGAFAQGERDEGVCSFAEDSAPRSPQTFVRTSAGCRSETGVRNAPSDLADASRGPVPGRGRLRRRVRGGAGTGSKGEGSEGSGVCCQCGSLTPPFPHSLIPFPPFHPAVTEGGHRRNLPVPSDLSRGIISLQPAAWPACFLQNPQPSCPRTPAYS
jgi:hypothetical protein